MVTEYDVTATIKALHNNNPQRIDEQFALTEAGTKYWPVCDALGSIYEWVDRSGNVAGAYSYDVYGARTQTSGGLSTAWGYGTRAGCGYWAGLQPGSLSECGDGGVDAGGQVGNAHWPQLLRIY